MNQTMNTDYRILPVEKPTDEMLFVYRVFGELKDFPSGHTRYYMTKQL